MEFRLKAPFALTGDQPQAVGELVRSLKAGHKDQVLLGATGIGPENLDRVLLAGGFGNYLDPASALAVGLLPAGVDRERIRSVGNASLAGARLYLLSEAERDEAAELSRSVRYIELSGRADFQEAFAEHIKIGQGKNGRCFLSGAGTGQNGKNIFLNSVKWRAMRDSNSRPLAPEANALSN